MARKRSEFKVDRRKFLTGVAVAGTATAVAASQQAANAASGASLQSDAVRPTPSAVLPSAKLAAAEIQLPPELPRVGGPAGSDFMVDVIKSLNIEYIFANPASSFRGLHESLLTYGKNTQHDSRPLPEFNQSWDLGLFWFHRARCDEQGTTARGERSVRKAQREQASGPHRSRLLTSPSLLRSLLHLAHTVASDESTDRPH